MIARWLRHVFVLAAMSVACVASAGGVWFTDGVTVNRYVRETGALTYLHDDLPVIALASRPVSGAWVIRGDRLQRLTDELVVDLDIGLGHLGALAGARLVVDSSPDGVWVSKGNNVEHYSEEGSMVARWTHDQVVHDVVAGGPGAIWIASASGVFRYGADGTAMHAWQAINMPDGATSRSLLFDRAGGYLWMILAGEAIRLDAMRALEEGMRLSLPADTRAVGIDALDGTFWIGSKTALTALDRQGRVVSVVPIEPVSSQSPNALAPESGTPVAWLGDAAGLSLVNRESLQWIRLAAGAPALAVAAAAPSLRPALSAEIADSRMRLRFSADCAERRCADHRRYVEGSRLHAWVGRTDVSAAFHAESGAGDAAIAAIAELRPYGQWFSAVLVDAYGTRSEPTEVDLEAIERISPGRMRREANAPPTVTLTKPSASAKFTAPANVDLAATATDSDGTVAKVEFFAGTTKLATDTAAPFSHTWSNVAAGTYSLTARATDNAGAVTTSAAVSVRVNRPPTVRITSPADGAKFVAPASVVVKASASDVDGSVAKVEFLVNGIRLASDTSSPYAFTWANPPPGTHALVAKATDNDGTATSSGTITVTVAVNSAPSVAITSPIGGEKLIAGVPVTINVAASDVDGTVKKVEFYARSVSNFRFATDTTAPFAATTSFGAGSVELTAVATDDKGATSTSAPVLVTVVENQIPVVRLLNPLDQQSFVSQDAPDISLEATAADADGKLVSLRILMLPDPSEDGVPMTMANFSTGPYTATWYSVPHTYPDGPLYGYSIWAEAIDDAGAVGVSDVAFIKVVRSTPVTVELLEPGEAGITGAAVFDAPATIVFRARAAVSAQGAPVATVEFVADGEVVGSLAAANGADGDYVSVWRDVPVGTRGVVARVTDALGTVAVSDPVTIKVLPANVPPQVALTAPAHAQVFYNFGGGADVAVSALGGDADGALTQLRLVDNGRWFDSSTVSPFATTLAANPGLHVLTAQAVDDRGAVTESRPAFASVAYSPRAPAIVLTSPAPGAVFSSSTAVTMAVDVASLDRPVAVVEFMDGPYVRATRTSPPYSYTMPLPEGPHALRAIARVPFAAPVESAPVMINVVGNGVPPPTVALVVPTDGEVFLSPASIPFAVSTDQPGRISSVVYHAGTAEATWSQQPPFTATWNMSGAGAYALYATAYYDNGSGRVISLPRSIEVRADEFAELTAPSAGSASASGMPIQLVGRVGLRKGVARIEFLVNGAVLGSVGVAGGPQVASATLTWSGASVGYHAVEVRGYAADGTWRGMLPASVNVTNGGVSIVGPHAGQKFVAAADIRITASPVSSTGDVVWVEFYGDGFLLGGRNTAPWTMTWTGVGAGSHTVHARMRDSNGVWSVSAPVGVVVIGAPSISVDAGHDGSAVADDSVSIGGIVQAPENSAVSVNGRLAPLDRSGRYFADNVPLNPGANTLTLVLNTQDAPPTVRTIIVNSTARAAFSVSVDDAEGLAPLKTRLRIVNRADATFDRIEIDTRDSGVPDLVLTSLEAGEASVELNYATPGLYTVAVRVLDQAGSLIHSAKRRVKVLGSEELAYRVVDVFRTLVDRMAAGNVSGTVDLFVAGARNRYAEVFAGLALPLADVAAQFGTPIDGVVAEGRAELTILRPAAGGDELFMVYLVRGSDGVWRVEGM